MSLVDTVISRVPLNHSRFLSLDESDLTLLELELPDASSFLAGLGAHMLLRSACCFGGAGVPFGSSKNLPNVDCLPMIGMLIPIC